MKMKKMKKIVAAALAMSMIVSMAGCGTSSTKDDGKKWSGKTLVVCSWGGAIQAAQKKTIFDAFAEKYGATVVEATDPDPAKIKAMVDAKKMEVDVWDVDSDFVPRGEAQGLFEKLDFNVISKDGLIPDFITDYSVPAEIATLCISWNTSKVKSDNHPTTWTQFFDTKTFPGKRTLYSNPMSMFEAVLLADGVKKEDMYPLDVDRAFKYLDAHKKDIVTFWASGAQSVELVGGGDASLGSVWGGRIIAAQKDGQPVEKETNEAILTGDSWVIGKGSQNAEMAQDFIAFATSAEVIKNYAVEYPGNAPANTKAYDLMTKEQIAALASSPELAKTQLYISVDWWFKNYSTVYERFQKWLIS